LARYLVPNSAMQSPNDTGFSFQTVGSGLLSTPLMAAPKTRVLKSEAPAAISEPLGCQSIDRTVERMGFLMCLETHQSFS